MDHNRIRRTTRRSAAFIGLQIHGLRRVAHLFDPNLCLVTQAIRALLFVVGNVNIDAGVAVALVLGRS